MTVRALFVSGLIAASCLAFAAPASASGSPRREYGNASYNAYNSYDGHRRSARGYWDRPGHSRYGYGRGYRHGHGHGARGPRYYPGYGDYAPPGYAFGGHGRGGRGEWCAARYRSYNWRTGYYRGYDGRLHYCG